MSTQVTPRWAQSRRGRLIGAASSLALLAAALWPVPGEASFPGRNGLIAYGVLGELDGCDPATTCTGSYLESVYPRRPSSRRRLTCNSPMCSASSPAWSRLGGRLAFSGDRGIFVSDPEGSRRKRVTARGSNPAWSPDGRHLVFQGDSTPRRKGVAKIDLFIKPFGLGTRRLTYRGGDSATWSSRGRIAFVRRNRDFEGSVYLLRRKGGGARRLRSGEHPDWSPDGKRLAIEVEARGRSNIVIIDRRGRRLRTVTRRGGTYPAWSPDGRRIAFHRGFSLYSVKATGGGLKRVVRFVGDAVNGITWQPQPRR